MKAKILEHLHKDHINYSKLLDIMDACLKDQEQEESTGHYESIGYYEMYLIMQYMIRYPDLFHHPCEDIIFDKIKTIDNSETTVIDKLHKEHEEIAAAGQALSDMLQAVTTGHILKKQVIHEAATKYSDLMRSHMNIEEAEVFPFIEDKMKQEDWQSISNNLEKVKDPLFGEVLSDEFRLLYDKIIELNG